MRPLILAVVVTQISLASPVGLAQEPPRRVDYLEPTRPSPDTNSPPIVTAPTKVPVNKAPCGAKACIADIVHNPRPDSTSASP